MTRHLQLTGCTPIIYAHCSERVSWPSTKPHGLLKCASSTGWTCVAPEEPQVVVFTRHIVVAVARAPRWVSEIVCVPNNARPAFNINIHKTASTQPQHVRLQSNPSYNHSTSRSAVGRRTSLPACDDHHLTHDPDRTHLLSRQFLFKTKPRHSALSQHKLSNLVKNSSNTVTETTRRWRDRADAAVPCGAGRGPARDARSICCSLPHEIQSFSLLYRLKTGISADVKRSLGVLATLTQPGPTLHLCNEFQIVELRHQILAGLSALLACSSSATSLPAQFLSHHGHAPRSYLQPLILSRPTQTFLVCAMSVASHLLARTRAHAQNQHTRALVQN